jgi:putative Mn2+ efflux pump MntP
MDKNMAVSTDSKTDNSNLSSMGNTLTRFRSKLKKRLRWAGLYNIFVVLIIFVNRYVGNHYSLSDRASGFTTGVFIGIELLVVIGIFKIQSALKDESKLRALYIKEHDERTLAIENKIGGLGINLIIAGLGLATVVTIYIEQTVFFTILGTLMFTVLVKGGLKLYYHKTL